MVLRNGGEVAVRLVKIHAAITPAAASQAIHRWMNWTMTPFSTKF
jgi:hypothetical protein